MIHFFTLGSISPSILGLEKAIYQINANYMRNPLNFTVLLLLPYNGSYKLGSEFTFFCFTPSIPNSTETLSEMVR